jgi:hypothetical protein
MTYAIFAILSILLFIFFCLRFLSYSQSIRMVEPLGNRDSKKVIILLGDSILANENYVPKGKSVVDILREEVGNEVEIAMFARDNYTIDDVYFQLSTLPIRYNTNDTIIVLSVGGNNLLTGTSVQDATREYMYLISRLRDTFGNSKIYLVNLYLPLDPFLNKLYNKIVMKWNSFLEKIVLDGIIDISKVITEPKDLVSKIEPSVVGGEKIVKAIVNSVGV